MAQRAMVICQRCGNAVQGRCRACNKAAAKAYDKQRGTAHQRGYGARWRAYRKDFLARNPLCVWLCDDGRPCNLPATDVDHIDPVSGPDDPGFWNESGLQPLCSRHHKVKSARDGSQSYEKPPTYH